MNYQRRLIQIVCTFVERALIPQIKKIQGSLSEWNKFYSLISANQINFSELQLYVDTLPAQIQNITPEKQTVVKKREDNDFEIGFNPSKTFGGQRNKLNMFQFGEEINKKKQGKDDSFRNKTNSNSQLAMGRLKKLLVSVEQNQQIIQGLGKESKKGVETGQNNRNGTYYSPTLQINQSQKNYY